LNPFALDSICYNRYRDDVSKPRPNATPGKQDLLEETTFVELLHTADRLSRGPAALLKQEDLSMTQYNVLRILRGAPEGLPCGEIGRRLVTREPDITRLFDRMEKRGLISRCRESKDRRTVLTRITDAGLKTVNRLDEPVQELHRSQLAHLGRERLRALTGLLRTAREKL
jgi:DNA-binding MarR family transcriptional regulator